VHSQEDSLDAVIAEETVDFKGEVDVEVDVEVDAAAAALAAAKKVGVRVRHA
jgi:hypothetical protein